jgi:putative copper resistance protein D
MGFLALAIFAFVRGDTENWPMGPISFWKSFYDPEVLLHRVYELGFVVYATFEMFVQTGRIKDRRAAYVWPTLLALGGAGLLLHDHALGNVKADLLIEMSHNQLAVLAVFGGWTRWLEVRMDDNRIRRIAAYAWPMCLVLIGIVLLNYREA